MSGSYGYYQAPSRLQPGRGQPFAQLPVGQQTSYGSSAVRGALEPLGFEFDKSGHGQAAPTPADELNKMMNNPDMYTVKDVSNAFKKYNATKKNMSEYSKFLSFLQSKQYKSMQLKQDKIYNKSGNAVMRGGGAKKQRKTYKKRKQHKKTRKHRKH